MRSESAGGSRTGATNVSHCPTWRSASERLTPLASSSFSLVRASGGGRGRRGGGLLRLAARRLGGGLLGGGFLGGALLRSLAGRHVGYFILRLFAGSKQENATRASASASDGSDVPAPDPSRPIARF